MNSQQLHASDDELLALISADENRDDVTSANTSRTGHHIECCDTCRMRLADLSGGSSVDQAARELLSDYPWDQLETSRSLSHASPADLATQNLDFLSAPSHPEMLGRLGRYEVERVIGCGGMGVVLKAFDSELNRPVAIKVLAPHLAHNGAARQRFARESRSAAAVVHEHVVAIHNVDTDGDVPFLVMQFVAGESLQARVERDGPLDTRQTLRIGSQIASGLAAAHQQGVVHRDIKPANILLEHGVERVLITDFGLARTVDDASLTQTGVIAGTPDYMSPEQASGEPTDHGTDLFSLGSVLYYMTTGHPPFRAERAMGVLNRICNHRPKPLWQIAEDVPDELSVLVERLLEKQRSRRIGTADEVHKKLANILVKTQQPRGSLRHQLQRCSYRYPKRIVAATTILALALPMVIAALIWPSASEQRRDSKQAADIALSSDPSERNTPTLFSARESEEFDATIQSLNQRIDALAADGAVVISPNNEPGVLQSLHQRLDRLQQYNSSESQFEQGYNR